MPSLLWLTSWAKLIEYESRTCECDGVEAQACAAKLQGYVFRPKK